MKPIKTKKRRVTARTDNVALEVALKISSLLLWSFYTVAALYVAYCNSFFIDGNDGDIAAQSVVRQRTTAALLRKAELNHKYSRAYYFFFPQGFDIAAFVPLVVRVLSFSAAATASTYFLANKFENGGELLMFAAWVIGALSDRFWLTSPSLNFGAAAAGAAATAAANATAAAAAAAASLPGGEGVVMIVDKRIPTVPGWLWLVVSIGTGLFSGIMCKVKDITDGKVERGHHLLRMFQDDDAVPSATAAAAGGGDAGSVAVDEAARRVDGMEGVARARIRRQRRIAGPTAIGLGERLYMVVPFCTGQWFSFILRHGWRGIVIGNGATILTLGMVGYTTLSFKLLRAQVYRASGRTTVVRYRRAVAADGEGTAVVEEDEISTSVDIIDLISKVFTTSFGAVVVGVIGVNVFITSMAIPFMKALFKLNALVSSVGIIVEIFVYEMV